MEIEPGTLLVEAMLLGTPPSTNNLWHISRNRTGLHKNPEAKRWEGDAIWLLRKGKKFEGSAYEGDVSCRMIVHAKNRRRADIDNMAKIALDACVDADIIKDDSQIQRLVIERVFDGQNQTEISLWAF